MGQGIAGPFTGFAFNGQHSSNFGITRVSSSNRYNDDLLPSMKDSTVNVEGSDETLYFGSNFQKRDFKINFAFDSVTESQLRDIKKWLHGDKKLHPLIFDDIPYKQWDVKVTGSATASYVCFSEGDDNRLYKGEGNVTFTAFNPFARGTFKTISEFLGWEHSTEAWQQKIFQAQDYSNEKIDPDEYKFDWQNSFEESFEESTNANNGGDLEVPVKIFISSKHSSEVTIELKRNSLDTDVIAFIKLNPYNLVQDDIGICIDTKLHLIRGYKENHTLSNNLYNQYLNSTSQMFKIPTGAFVISGVDSIEFEPLYI